MRPLADKPDSHLVLTGAQGIFVDQNPKYRYAILFFVVADLEYDCRRTGGLL
jgi:hypothetical protein